MARNALQYGGSDSDNPLSAAPWTIPDPSDPTAPISQGAAVTQTASAVDQWMEAQRQKSAQMGLWNDQTGLPTMAGVNAAVGDYGNALLMGTTAPGGKGPGFTAYHGSPHSFDAFDLSKIGTGEGAQAYGHGMYLADAEGVARTYRDMAAKPLSNPVNDTASAWLKDAGGDADKAVAAFSDFAKQSGLRADEIAEQTAAIHNVANAPRGHMYEVQVNADPEHFLDWDKPIGQQHQSIQDLAKQIGMDPRDFDIVKGAALYRRAGDHFGPSGGGSNFNAAASEGLQAAGIPGIRYLDAGSRGAGEGSRNSVVFNPANMEIIRKYGLAWLLGGGGAAATQGQQQQ